MSWKEYVSLLVESSIADARSGVEIANYDGYIRIKHGDEVLYEGFGSLGVTDIAWVLQKLGFEVRVDWRAWWDDEDTGKARYERDRNDR